MNNKRKTYLKGRKASFTGAMPIALLAAPVKPANASWKDDVLAEMQDIAQQVMAIKTQNGTEAQLIVTDIDTLLAQYADLSARLGGDDPANLLAGGTAANVQSATLALKVAPAPPPGLTATTRNFADSPGAAITDNNTVSVDINVNGVDSFLYDVDLTTEITHTWNADLDITLTSPSGTVTTISTNNGGSADNVFNGTLWDDSAAFTANDFPHANNVTSSPLQPEGALAKFIGENPNGTWTLTVTDDFILDIGTINSWSLDITTLNSAPLQQGPFTSTQTTATPIPDGPGGTVSSDLSVSGLPDFLCDIDLTTEITHTWNADLDITLTSPSGTVTTISTDNGGANDDVFNGTLWDDSAAVPVTDFPHANNVTSSPLQPEGALGKFIGENPNGTWTLTVTDDAGVDIGTINSWSLDITPCLLPPPLIPADIPTLSTWGLFIMTLSLGGAVLFARGLRKFKH